MRREQLSRVFCDLDERQIAEAYQFDPELCGRSPERIVHMGKKRIISFALAAALIITLGVAAYAAGNVIFGWGNNMEIRATKTDRGIETNILVHTDSLTEPVCLEDDRMFFIVNDEHIDITDQISETKAFIYQFTDSEGVIHYWIVGKNGPELWHYGYAEYVQPSEGDWIRGYVARTNNNEAPWLDNAREEIGFPLER